ncbi:hypothetical protein DUY81_11665 [Acidipropionibacterium acidipropionici]|uniref:Uncharacterized protein n=1 Tax=Acidipropionibacterium acidipropionici TaxID=1748 RepID=A0AAC8YI68_9ACTN|nr:hypothetical protein AXH35_16680 [Acidipropionibacterium acidipropionici]AOZ45624.1 hypothetical protein A8L58_01615 [Acidipropionibacterium acidipropionici]AZP38364.1 hypothetical protein DUY81_11665 [Acidipropionibacterium acidipropionici]
MEARMPCMSIPEGVSSMFSVTETRLMFASRSVAWMIASSRRLRARRSTLLMMQYWTGFSVT